MPQQVEKMSQFVWRLLVKVLIISRFNDKILDYHFWLLWKIKHQNHVTFMNQKVVFNNFIIEPTDEYFSETISE